MKIALLACASLLIAVPAAGQGRPSGDGPPGGGRGGGPGERSSHPQRVDPVKREDFDRAVTAIFVEADIDGSGLVTMDELRGIFRARRETIISERFDRIDTDSSGQISVPEFISWQSELGSLASSDRQIQDDFGPVEENIRPDLGDDPEDRMLARLIEPLGTLALANANTDYDSGMSLTEWLAYQAPRFEEADANGDGRITMEEMPRDERRDERRGEAAGETEGGAGGRGTRGSGPPPQRRD